MEVMLILLVFLNVANAHQVDPHCRAECIWQDDQYCHQFWRCIDGTAHKFNCPSHLMFNADGEYCDFSQNVDCGSRSRNDTDISKNKCTKEYSLLPGDFCDEYIVCTNGNAIRMICPKNFRFDIFMKACNKKENVNCGLRPERLPKQKDYEIICTAQIRKGPTKNCNEYYVCIDVKAVTHECLLGMFFNEETLDCDWYNKVNCGDRINKHEITTTENPNPENQCIDHLPDSILPGHFCDEYIVCTNGIPIKHLCPTNYRFDIFTKACVKKKNVNCGLRPEPFPKSKDYEIICTVQIVKGPTMYCHEYYVCTGGGAVTQECPIGMLFNIEILDCDWYKKVNCGDRINKHEISTTENPNPENQCIDHLPNSILPGYFCDEYIVCTNGNRIKHLCPRNYRFDTVTKACDKKENVNCGLRPKLKDYEIICTVQIRIGPTKNCHEYYVCTSEGAVTQQCPFGMLFNIDILDCDWYKNVNCGDRINKHEITTTENPNPENQCIDHLPNSILPGFFCDEYIVCTNGKPIKHLCPTNYRFDIFTKACVKKDNVNCGLRPEPLPKPKDYEIICTIQIRKGPTMYCHEYYVCTGDGAVTQQCPFGMLFNIEILDCDWYKKVNCGDRINKHEITTTENPNPENQCIDHLPNSILPSYFCDEYIVCTNGNPIKHLCPRNYRFDTVTKACDKKENVNCGLRPKLKDYEIICTVQIRIGPTKNCHEYYVCTSEGAVTQQCPFGMLFNIDILDCDWYKNVNCGDRINKHEITVTENPNPENQCIDHLPKSILPGYFCDEYIVCTNDNPIKHLCPTNYRFDIFKKACVKKDNVNCGLRPEPLPKLKDYEIICTIQIRKGPTMYCHEYYVCTGDSAVTQQCPFGMLFNIDILDCDWYKNVNCGDRINKHEITVTENPNPENQCIDHLPNSILPGYFCDEYIVCTNGNPIKHLCPANYRFDIFTKACVKKDNVNCGLRPEPLPKPKDYEIICTIQIRKGPTMYCHEYYVCTGDSAVTQQCPFGMLFNIEILDCDWYKKVNCGDRINKHEITTTENPNPVNQCIDHLPNSILPGYFCDDYIVCTNGNPIKHLCPRNYRFDTVTKACDKKENVNCGLRPKLKDYEIICTVQIRIGPTKNCHEYYVCTSEGAVTQQCPFGMLFNIDILDCDWYKNVNCGDRINKHEITTSENPIPENQCIDHLPNSILPGYFCDEYIVCTNGNPIKHLCPTNYRFDIFTKACVKKENVNCGLRPEPLPKPKDYEIICTIQIRKGPTMYCHEYYVCTGGGAVTQQCPVGMLFNIEILDCDWYKKVKCGDRINKHEITTTENPNPKNQCIDHLPDSILPGYFCDEYIVCTNGNPIKHLCPRNYRFDTVTKACDKKENVNCGLRPKLKVYEIICTVQIRIGPTKNCHEYYVCTSEGAVTQQCPFGMLFNIDILDCDWYKNVNCGDRINKHEITTTENLIPENQCIDHLPNSILPGYFCDEYIVCKNGNPIKHLCPTNYRFDIFTKACVKKENVNCGLRPEPLPKPKDYEIICTIQIIKGPTMYCHEYYVCTGGGAVTQQCPIGMLFNIEILDCDWYKKVNCGDRINKNEITTTENPNPENKCIDHLPNSILPGHFCDEYIVCTDGNPIKYLCPANYRFDTVTKACVNKENVNCGLRPEPFPKPKDYEIICTVQIIKGPTMYCHEYYVCTGGGAVTQQCPIGMLFNIEILDCDWYKKVNCGDRINKHEITTTENPNPENKCIDHLPNSILPGHFCDEYIVCTNGNPIKHLCPANYRFDSVTKACKKKENVNCGLRPKPKEYEIICTVQMRKGPTKYCHVYYLCTGAGAVTQQCPFGMLFNTEILDCDWYKKVNCDDRINKHEITTTENPNPENQCIDHLPNSILPGHFCDEFIVCTNGNPIKHLCQTNYRFDTVTKTCINKENVNCELRPEPFPKPKDYEIICTIQIIKGPTMYCHEYYVCTGGGAVTQQCPIGMLFNIEILDCDWYKKVNCGDRINKHEINTTENPNPENQCIDHLPNSVLPGYFCDEYIVCTNGNPIEHLCQINYRFDTVTKACVNKENVNCGLRPEPFPKPKDYEIICTVQIIKGPTMYCHEYYVCTGGGAVTQQCPIGMLFNIEILDCDWYKKVNCGDRINKHEITTTENPNPENKCIDHLPNSILPGHFCDEYIVCTNGNPIKHLCPANYRFDSVTKACEKKENVNCGLRPKPKEYEIICTVQMRKGPTKYCHVYYLCTGAGAVTQQCPFGMLFNTEFLDCDWYKKVNCGDRINKHEITTTENPNPENQCIDHLPNSILPGHFCDEFIVCTNGNPIKHLCQTNYSFDTVTKTCINKENVNCELRPEPFPKPKDYEIICTIQIIKGPTMYCHEYYVCTGGGAVTQQCPIGMLFNIEILDCDWYKKVNCGDRINKHEITSTENPNPENQCIDHLPNSVLPGYFCDEYIVCTNGNPIEHLCQTNYRFDTVMKACVNKENVNCGLRPEPFPKPKDYEIICSVQIIKGPTMYCHEYYVCTGGGAVTQQCPNGMLFNIEILDCDWYKKVNCGDRINKHEITTTENPNPENQCIDHLPNSVLPGYFCDEYIICKNGNPIEHLCQINYRFDTVTKACVNKENVNCGLRPEPFPKPKDYEIICTVQIIKGPTMYCHEYYVCTGGGAVTQQCPIGMLFNIEILDCDWYKKVNCGERINKHEITTTENPNPENKCIDHLPNTILPGRFCDEYIVCTNGYPIKHLCPANYRFDSDTKACDKKENVNCGLRPKLKDFEIICTVQMRKGPTKYCHVYYLCTGAGAVTQQCPFGMLFNIDILDCDWYKKVNCGDRINKHEITTTENPNPENQCIDHLPNSILPGHFCDEYVVCMNGNQIRQTCPKNYRFDTSRKACNKKENVNCGLRPERFPKTKDYKIICTAQIRKGPTKYCHEYYVCTGVGAVVIQCPIEKLFNMETLDCHWYNKVNCGDRINKHEINTTENPNPENQCIDHLPNSVLPGYFCDEYIVCTNGNPIKHLCQTNYRFDTVTKACVKKENFNCGLRPERFPNLKDYKIICTAQIRKGPTKYCHEYYVCTGVGAVIIQCPIEKLFNIETLDCGWYNNVNCGDRINKHEISTTKNPNPENQCIDHLPNSILPGHFCDEFIVCTNGNPIKHLCPKNYRFDTVMKACIKKENVNCGLRPEPFPKPKDYEIICTIQIRKGPTMYCHEYYVCTGGGAVTQQCPMGMLFNIDILDCDWYKKVNCGDRINKHESTTTKNTNPENQCIDHLPNSILPGHFCDEYVVCMNGNRIRQTCQKNYRFDTSRKACNKKENVNCGLRPERFPKPKDYKIICTAQIRKGPTKYCHEYYVCTGVGTVIIQCPIEKLFNIETLDCDWYKKVNCGDRIYKYEITTTENPNPENQCIDHLPNSILPGHFCDEYIVCTNGNPIEHSCPTNYRFDTVTKACDKKENVNCGLRPKLKDYKIICTVKIKKGPTLYCHEFYICTGVGAVIKKCHIGKLFNIETLDCDWYFKVNCGDRVNKYEITNTENPKPENQCIDHLPNSILPGHFCDEYLVCTNGNAIKHLCQTNYRFDTVTKACDKKENVNCGLRPDPFPKPKDYEIICTVQIRKGPTKYCHEYYVCTGGGAVTQQCPIEMLFNIETLDCDWYNKVNCGDRINNPNPENQCVNGDTTCKFFAHKNCHQFYICIDNTLQLLDCPDDLLYNIENSTCSSPKMVDCGNRQNPHEKKITETITYTSHRPFSISTLSDDLSETTTISFLTTKTPFTSRETPLSTDIPFTSRKTPLSTEPPLSTESTLRTTKISTTTTTSLTTTKLPLDKLADLKCGEGNIGHYVFLPHAICRNYYICVYGTASTQTCDEHKSFDDVKGSCEPDNTVNCGSRTNSNKLRRDMTHLAGDKNLLTVKISVLKGEEDYVLIK